MVTLAPGTTPFVSLTVPTMVPVVTWAATDVAIMSAAAERIAARRLRFVIARAPRSAWPPKLALQTTSGI
jgi:hypothetical protein